MSTVKNVSSSLNFIIMCLRSKLVKKNVHEKWFDYIYEEVVIQTWQNVLNQENLQKWLFLSDFFQAKYLTYEN